MTGDADRGEPVTEPDENAGRELSDKKRRESDTHDGADTPAAEGGECGATERDKSNEPGPWPHDRTLVRVTEDVGEILGVDGRDYDLRTGDVVTLPAVNADPLLAKDIAIELDGPADDVRRASISEAEAVAGSEPERDVDREPDPAFERAIEREIAKRSEPDDPEPADGGSVSLAAAMGGSDSPLASDDTPDRSSTPSTSASEVTFERTASMLPLAQLDALGPDERRRAAKRRGLEWPTTDQAREQLFDTVATVMRNEDDQVIDAPTSLGKSYTVATTRWGAREDLTGDQPVVHLSATRKARDEAARAADAEGGAYIVLSSRHELCGLATGDFDPDKQEDDDAVAITVNGQPASEFIDEMCDGRGIPFSVVHHYVEEHNDQDADPPCCEDGDCAAIKQWDEYRQGPEGDLDHWPLVIATHNFAYAPGLRVGNNVVVDEEPDFEAELSTGDVRRAIRAFLQAIDAPVTTWASFIRLARYDPDTYDEVAAEVVQTRDRLEEALDRTPSREWYFEHPDAHTLAPGLAKAIMNSSSQANGRRSGWAHHEPPRLEAEAHEEEYWNREKVSIVFDDDEDAEIHTVRTVPDFGACRSVIGLDAHPALPVWQANTVPWINSKPVLDPDERHLWRRYERGLRVVQVGDATRPLTSGKYFDDRGAEAIVEHLREEYGEEFRTAITAMSVRDRLAELMDYVGIDDPELMHYGDVKSRNDFAGEDIGFVNGCIDPGDGHIINLLAELDLDAEPVRSDPEECDDPENAECDHCEGEGCPECLGTGLKRAPGREFVGPDADTAQAILASVRENQVAQAAGRYARDPDDPADTATVFVRTDAIPAGFADVQVAGVEWVYTAKQERVVKALREHEQPATVRDLVEETGVSKSHVHRALNRLVDHGTVQAFERAGPNGATLYADDGTPNSGVVDLTAEDGETVPGPVLDSYTWAGTVRDVLAGDSVDGAVDRADATPTDGLYAYINGGDGSDPPPDGRV